jgi:hypothetical protein
MQLFFNVKSPIEMFNQDSIDILTSIAFNRTMCEALRKENKKQKNISGLMAHDLSLIVGSNKNVLGKMTKNYTFKISKDKKMLSDNILKRIFKNGLLDLKLIIKRQNRETINKMAGFLYKIQPSLYNSKELMQEIYKEAELIEEDIELENLGKTSTDCLGVKYKAGNIISDIDI